MEDLTKSQIILLALFVSFVTSIATGIVTVSLMEQAPAGVTNTINRVVEKSVQKVSPTSEKIVEEKVVQTRGDLIAGAVAGNKKGIVQFMATVPAASGTRRTRTGMGIVVSERGIVATDDRLARHDPAQLAAEYKGETFAVRHIPLGEKRDYTLYQLVAPASSDASERATSSESGGNADDPSAVAFDPVPLGDPRTASLGDTAIALTKNGSLRIHVGVISQIVSNTDQDPSSGVRLIRTDVPLESWHTGSPLLGVEGEVLGMYVASARSQHAIPLTGVSEDIAKVEEALARHENEATAVKGDTQRADVFHALFASATRTPTSTSAAPEKKEREDAEHERDDD